MPELPEVETMRRGVLAIVGSRIVRVELVRGRLRPLNLAPRLSQFRARVEGSRITAIGRVGKRVVLELDRPRRIVFEPRMTGLVLLADPPDCEHLRLRLALEGGPAAELFYWDRRGLGWVRCLEAGQFQAAFGEGRLGPDALEIAPDELRGRLGRSRRAIKVALLDQAAVAGIGNLYAAEILHRARIDPRRSACALRPGQWRALAAAVREVLELAIRYEGSTLSDGTYRNALNQAGSFQNHHRVYDRAGQTCLTCRRGRIRRIVQAQRATFYCPCCQRPGRAAASGQQPAGAGRRGLFLTSPGAMQNSARLAQQRLAT